MEKIHTDVRDCKGLTGSRSTLGSSISKGNSISFPELQYALENKFLKTWILPSRHYISSISQIFF